MLEKSERLWTKDYIIVMLAALGTSFCNNFFFIALPLYAEKITGSGFYSGLMLTAYTVAALLSRPFSGIASDKFGRVKLLIIGAFICAVACALYGVTTSMLMIMVIRAINGFGFGIHSTCAGAVAADVVPKSRLSEGIGYFSLYGTIAGAIAPSIALAIISGDTLEDYRLLFFVSSGICVLSMIFDCMVTYERKRKKARSAAALADTLLQSDRKPDNAQNVQAPENDLQEELPKTFLGFEYGVFLPAAVLCLLFFAQTSSNTFLTLFAKEQAMGNIGLFFTFNAGGMFLSRILFGKMTDRHGTDVVVIPGIIGIIIFYLIMPFVHGRILLFALGLPLGLVSGTVFPAMNSLIFKRCSPQRRGTASAAYFASIDIGLAVGGVIFGFAAAKFGYSSIYWMAAVISLVALLLYLKTMARKKKKKLITADDTH